MDAIADKPDGIGNREFGFGFRFEEALFSGGGFESETFGLELFGPPGGENSIENDGSHILVDSFMR